MIRSAPRGMTTAGTIQRIDRRKNRMRFRPYGRITGGSIAVTICYESAVKRIRRFHEDGAPVRQQTRALVHQHEVAIAEVKRGLPVEAITVKRRNGRWAQTRVSVPQRLVLQQLARGGDHLVL